jgi:hypothetical protein
MSQKILVQTGICCVERRLLRWQRRDMTHGRTRPDREWMQPCTPDGTAGARFCSDGGCGPHSTVSYKRQSALQGLQDLLRPACIFQSNRTRTYRPLAIVRTELQLGSFPGQAAELTSNRNRRRRSYPLLPVVQIPVRLLGEGGRIWMRAHRVCQKQQTWAQRRRRYSPCFASCCVKEHWRIYGNEL